MPGPFDVFISYSRRDDVGPDGASGGGWVSALKKVLETSSAGGPPLRVFFDTADIRVWEDWRHRILAALRQSKVLVVCLSPAYFESEYCRWEWEHFVRRRGQKHAQGDGESIQAIRLAAFPGTSISAEWLASVRRGTTRDLSPWTSESPELLQQEGPASEEVQRLVEALVTRVRRAQRELALAYGNMRAATEHFVGRRAQLQALHEHVRLGGVGVLTALHGLGGIGKTELAVFYANEYARSFPAGIWWIDAAPYADLRAAIGALAEVPGFLSTPVPSGSNAEQRFAQVMHTLHNRSRESREQDTDEDCQVLLVLDNVDQPVLFSANQRVHVAQHPWLSILITTRQISEPPDQADRLKVFPLEALDPADALALIREWQPGQAFRDAPDAVAADALIRDLDGYTLAVEQVAAFLGGNPDLSIARFHAELQRQGLQSLDQLHDDPAVRGVRLHREGQLKLILEQTLPPVGSLERLLLDYAACFGPDAVPVPWIEALVREHFPEAVSLEPARFGVDPMAKAWRWLEQRRLLTPSSCSELRRMHRLVREHVALAVPQGLHEHVEQCVNRTQADFEARWRKQPMDAWTVDALADWACQEGPKTHLRGRSLGVLANCFLVMRGPLMASLYARKSLMIHEHLVDVNPIDVTASRAVSISLDIVGQTLEAQGDLDGALAAFERGLVVCQKRSSSFDDERWLRDLSNSFCHIGRIRLAKGQFSDALLAFRMMLEIARGMVKADPNCLIAQRELAVALGFAGKALLRSEAFEAALECFEEGLLISEKLVRIQPQDLLASRDLTVALNDIGDVRAHLNDPRGALKAYQRMLEINRQRASANPKSIEAQRDVSVGLINVGRMKAAFGDSQGALADAQVALHIREELARADTTNISALRDIIVSRELLWQIENDWAAKVEHAAAICRIFQYFESRGLLVPNGDLLGWRRLSDWLEIVAGKGQSRQI